MSKKNLTNGKTMSGSSPQKLVPGDGYRKCSDCIYHDKTQICSNKKNEDMWNCRCDNEVANHCGYFDDDMRHTDKWEKLIANSGASINGTSSKTTKPQKEERQKKVVKIYEVVVGMCIFHKTFGEGKIIEVDNSDKENAVFRVQFQYKEIEFANPFAFDAEIVTIKK